MTTTLQPMTVATTVQPSVAPPVIDVEVVPNDAPDLNALATEIEKLQVEIDGYSALSKRHGKLALELAIKTGGLLKECQKEVYCKKQDGWLEWLRKNVKSIEYITVTRYIRLFNYSISHEIGLNDCDSIREAYYLVGIFSPKPLTEEKEKPQRTKAITPTVPNPLPVESSAVEQNRVDKVESLVKQIKELFEGATEDERREIRNALKPLVIVAKGFDETDKELLFKLGTQNAKERGEKFKQEMKQITEAIG